MKVMPNAVKAGRIQSTQEQIAFSPFRNFFTPRLAAIQSELGMMLTG